MSPKKRLPRLTRVEKMTKGLMLPKEEMRSKFTVREVEEKGRALFLYSRIIRKDSFVLEYEGDVITHDEAVLREKIYQVNDEGCFILFFRFQGRRLAIDATRKFDSFARYLNHSRDPNIRFHPPLLLDLTGQGRPRIAAYALKDIHEGDEIVFDYGISDGQLSWLRNRKKCHMSELTDSSDDANSESESESSEEKTKEDVIMSVRSPHKLNSDKNPCNEKLNITVNKFVLPNDISVPTKPPIASLPSDGYGIRFIRLSSLQRKRKSYIATAEGLGQPLKIMRSVEERHSCENQSKKTSSVISLSESDDCSKKSNSFFDPSVPPPSHYNYNDSSVLFDAEPSSTSKVLEWQQKHTTSSTQIDSGNDLKILHVTSLKDFSSQSLVPDHFPTSNCYARNQDETNTLPSIMNIMNGSSIPKSFLPRIHLSSSSSDDSHVKTEKIRARHHPSSSMDFITSRKHLLPDKAEFTSESNYSRSDSVSVPVKLRKVGSTVSFPSKIIDMDVISLSDSEEENQNLSSQNRTSPKSESPKHSHLKKEYVTDNSNSMTKDAYKHKSVTETHNLSNKQSSLSHHNHNQHSVKDDQVTEKKSLYPPKQNHILPTMNENERFKLDVPGQSSKGGKSPDVSPLSSDIEIDSEGLEDEKSDIEIISDVEGPSAHCLTDPKKEQTACALPKDNDDAGVSRPHATSVKTSSADNCCVTTARHEDQVKLTQGEIEMMKQIFKPLILLSDIKEDVVESTISENFDFFSVLIERGVRVNDIRKTVWSLFKFTKKDKT